MGYMRIIGVTAAFYEKFKKWEIIKNYSKLLEILRKTWAFL